MARPTCMRTQGAIATLVLAVLLGGCAGRLEMPPPAAIPPPTTSETDPSDRDPGRDLVLTGPPRIPWVDGSVVRLPDGDTLQLPRAWGHTSVVAYAGGYLVTDDRFFEGTVGMHRLDADGTVLDSWTSTGPALPSRDGRVAWVSLVAPESGLRGPTLLHADSVDGGTEVTQRLDRSRMPFLTGWFRGRLVYETWGESASFLTDLVHPPRPVPRAEEAGIARRDGAYAVRLTRDGVEFLHHDGQLVNEVRIRGLGRTLGSDIAWEDDRRVLTTLTRGGRQAVVRIGMGGRVSLATPWREPDWTGFAFLARRP